METINQIISISREYEVPMIYLDTFLSEYFNQGASLSVNINNLNTYLVNVWK